jgi:hypothetical protein
MIEALAIGRSAWFILKQAGGVKLAIKDASMAPLSVSLNSSFVSARAARRNVRGIPNIDALLEKNQQRTASDLLSWLLKLSGFLAILATVCLTAAFWRLFQI